MSQDEHALDAAYRAAHTVADKPPAAVRARIMAEAEAASRRRLPVANASRYWMRAVAGFAVLGFVVVLIRQIEYRLPGEAAQTVAVEGVSDSQPSRGAAQSAAPAAEAMLESAGEGAAPATDVQSAQANRSSPANAAPPALRREESVQQKAQATADLRAPEPAAPAPATAPAPAPPPPPPPPGASRAQQTEQFESRRAAAASSQVEEVVVTAARNAESAERERAASVGPRATPQALSQQRATDAAAVSAEQLVRTHFPEQYQSARAHRLWLVRDAAGEVFRVGEITADRTLAELAREIEPTLSGRRVASWRTESIRNARGQAIELNIGELR